MKIAPTKASTNNSHARGEHQLDMWNLAADLGLNVVESRGQHRSGYDPGEHVIHLRRGMTSRVTRSVLAHEIAHHVLGHRPVGFGPLRARQERAANEWAATQLIAPDRYAHAERLHHDHIPLLAAELHVADELVAVYQTLLTRISSTVYVSPRMGAGQYAHRIEVS